MAANVRQLFGSRIFNDARGSYFFVRCIENRLPVALSVLGVGIPKPGTTPASVGASAGCLSTGCEALDVNCRWKTRHSAELSDCATWSRVRHTVRDRRERSVRVRLPALGQV